MSKPKLLDLFCGAGGAGMGYYRAGFEVTGIDIKSQPRYPFTFIQGDALEYLEKHGHEYDIIHASPPCQRFTKLNNIKSIKQHTDNYADLVNETRDLLRKIGKPFVIENVSGAPLETSIILCGAMFGLKVYRHRLFESSILLFQPAHIPHNDKTPMAGRGISPKGFISVCGFGCASRHLPDGMNYLQYARMAMGIDYMNAHELAESIPPAFTEWIGKQLIGVVA